MATTYLCPVCAYDAEIDSIECSSCNQWFHRKCIPMTCKQMNTWKDRTLNFLCKSCAFVADDQFNFKNRWTGKVFTFLQFCKSNEPTDINSNLKKSLFELHFITLI